MGKLGSSHLVLVLLAMVVVLFSGEKMTVLAAPGQLGCKGDMQGLMTQCAVYVQKGTPMLDPSQACCSAVRTVDMPCVCQRLSKEIEQIVDMNKVFHVASSCGRPLAPGIKCGRSTVP